MRSVRRRKTLLAFLLPIGKSATSNEIFRKCPGRPQTKRMALGGGCRSSREKFFRVVALRGFLNLREFTQFKNNNSSKTNLTECDDGSLKLVIKFDSFPTDTESIKQDKTPYFLKYQKSGNRFTSRQGYALYRITKNGAILYTKPVTRSQWPVRTTDVFRRWKNSEQRPSISGEASLQHPPAKEPPVEMATGQVSLSHRIFMELAPKPAPPGLPPPGLNNKRKPGSQDAPQHKQPGLTKAGRKKAKSCGCKKGKVTANGVGELPPAPRIRLRFQRKQNPRPEFEKVASKRRPKFSREG